MKCPICKKAKVALCQDAIIPQMIVKKKSGGYSFYPMNEEINYLENAWLECPECHKTSQDNDQLAKLYKEVMA